MLTETRFVRADQLCLGDIIILRDPFYSSTVFSRVRVGELALVGDDVNVNGDQLMTSMGNVLRVERTVRPVESNRYTG